MSALDQVVKLSIRKKVAILGLVVVLIAAVFWFIYYDPLSEELSALQEKHMSLQNEKADANRRKATYEKDRERRDELKKSYGQQLRALPSDTEMSSFLNNLNAHAELVGLEIESVKPKKEEVSKYYARIPVQLNLTGSYYQLAKFFYLVGNLDRIINIENISLKIKKFEESSAILTANVLATTFRSVNPESGKKKKGKRG
jgi:type IV pilus assembly protein PilO